MSTTYSLFQLLQNHTRFGTMIDGISRIQTHQLSLHPDDRRFSPLLGSAITFLKRCRGQADILRKLASGESADISNIEQLLSPLLEILQKEKRNPSDIQSPWLRELLQFPALLNVSRYTDAIADALCEFRWNQLYNRYSQHKVLLDWKFKIREKDYSGIEITIEMSEGELSKTETAYFAYPENMSMVTLKDEYQWMAKIITAIKKQAENLATQAEKGEAFSAESREAIIRARVERTLANAFKSLAVSDREYLMNHMHLCKQVLLK